MTQKPDNPPAFPCIDNAGPNGQTVWRHDGMTLLTYAAIHLKQPISEREDINEAVMAAKRDELAAAALQGMLNADYATPDLRKSGEERFVDQKWVSLCAEQSYRFSDAMLKAREARHDD